jgi:DNA recombination protein RmuC
MPLLEILSAVILLAVIADIIFTITRAKPVDPEKLKRELLSDISVQQSTLLNSVRNELVGEIRASRTELTTTVQSMMKAFADALISAQNQTALAQDSRLKELTENVSKNQELLRTDIASKMSSFQTSQAESLTAFQLSVRETTAVLTAAQDKQFEMQDKRLHDISRLLTEAQAGLQTTVSDRRKSVDEQFKTFTVQSRESMDGIRTTVQNRLEALQNDNSQQLEKMRATVDEKLQKTLDDRITQSFKMVNDRLQEVYTGLGEMKTLASGVGDLKKVLTNVKTRGTWGEIQLGNILEEILTADQYETNIATKKGSSDRVEFAVKLPGDGDAVYLPIDAKFPIEDYRALLDAYDAADGEMVKNAKITLARRIKACAKDIHDKYIDVPNTTEFGIMFLPIEGLYAEVVKTDLVETLQRDYKINVAGPTTMAALLNSLQMGFKTLAIQKRSSEVWKLLGAVKTEFDSFGKVLDDAQKRITQANDELEKLVGTRTRMIQNKLKNVTALPDVETKIMLPADE